MNKSREKHITNLLHELADYNMFADELVNEDILQSHCVHEYVDIYENAYEQKTELFIAIEELFNVYVYDELLEPTPLMWDLFKTYFSHVWTYATNSYYEGYPLPEKMEFPNLLDLDIDLI